MVNNKFQLLVAEDEPKISRALEAFLTANGYAVLLAKDGQQALELFYSHSRTIDLLLLDVMMPYVGGFDVLKQVREKNKDVPVIMLTALATEEDQCRGLDGGANNYITKPFQLRVLKSHIDAQLRERSRQNSRTIEQGALSIQTEYRVATLAGKELDLTPKEFDVLHYFVSNARCVLNRDQILDAVWGLDFEGDIRTVDTIVKQLRRKLTKSYPYINSIYGVGYQFQVSEHEE